MVLLLLKILLWIYTKDFFDSKPWDELYFEYLLSLKGELHKKRHHPDFDQPGFYTNKNIIKFLLDSIILLEDLVNLKHICSRTQEGLPSGDMEIKKWNYVFENFWNFKNVGYAKHNRCYGTPYEKLSYATPINSDKLDSAILYTIDKISRRILLCNDAMKYNYPPLKLDDLMFWWDKKYERENYKKFVHLNIVHDSFDYENLAYLDKVPNQFI